MSQNSLVLPTTGTVSGLQMTQNTNNALDTLNTLASGASAPASPEAGQLWHDTTNNQIKIRSLDNSTWIVLFGLNESAYTGAAIPATAAGHCQFQYNSASQCSLVPLMGNKVTFPNGTLASLPAGGIATSITSCYLNGTAGSALSANTLYYAYLWNAGTASSPNFVIDWSTAGHVTDPTSGIEVKNGDNTRVLVGMAYPLAGPAFTSNSQARLIRSWFHDGGIVGTGTYGAVQLWSSNAIGEPNSNIRITFLCWAGETMEAQVNSSAYNVTTTNTISLGLGIDATTAFSASQSIVQTAGGSNGFQYIGASLKENTLGEGEHFITALAQSPNSTQIGFAAATTVMLKTTPAR